MGNIKKIIREHIKAERNNLLLEEATKSIVKNEVDKLLNSNKFKSSVKNEFSKLLKSREFEDIVIDIVRNALIQLYKHLWVKRSFWVNKITNKSS